MQALASFLNLLSDPTRLHIIRLLGEDTSTVSGISRALGISLPAVSHQLAMLYSANLVKYSKTGREKHYELTDKGIIQLLDKIESYMQKRGPI
ncbi:MAG: metalloregulator ArsR/SmtB family transcription factor [archaeon]